MRIAISGAAGFLASHLIPDLLAQGHEVVGIDLIHPNDAWRLHELALLPKIDYQWRPLDAGFRDILPVDLLINCAAITHPPFANRARLHTEYVNVHTAVAMMEAAVGWAGRVLHISTFSVYGPAPHVQDAAGAQFHGRKKLLESFPLHPSTFYGWSKAAQESAILSYSYRGEVPVTVLRMALMYGERERQDAVVSLFLTRALKGQTITLDGGGAQIRDMNYVWDTVRAINFGIEKGADGGIYNIPGTPVSIKDLAEAAVDFAGTGEIVNGPPRAGEEGNMVMGGTKAARELGYGARTKFRVGFRKTAEWLKARILKGR